MSRRVRRGFQRERFIEAIRAAGMTHGDLGRLAEVSVAAITSWERRGGTPDIERLVRVAGVLGVSLEELVHLPDEKCLPSDLRLRVGLTQVQLAAAAGLSTTAVSGFERAEPGWSDRKATAIASVLGISVEDLRAAWQRSRDRPPGAPA